MCEVGRFDVGRHWWASHQWHTIGIYISVRNSYFLLRKFGRVSGLKRLHASRHGGLVGFGAVDGGEGEGEESAGEVA